MNPRYDAAAVAALRSLRMRRQGKHGMSLQEIARMWAGEWDLDAAEEANLLLLLDKRR